ncbi:MAG: hypothetical protein JW902_09775, partial [Syntrophaceae bacterium]|nr:hypothetical protein [Syntrophaceae bacterium]
GQVCPLPHRRGLASKMASRAATGSFEIGSIVKLLKIAACLMLISGFLAALTVAFLMKDFHPPIKQRVNSIAFSGLKTPSLTIPPSMSGPGGLSAASSFMNNQNVNVILDFNKMPAFSMPKMPAKVCEGRR